MKNLEKIKREFVFKVATATLNEFHGFL